MTHEYVIALGGMVLGTKGAVDQPASAIAWAIDRVLAVGPDDEVRAISRGDSTFLDLRGAAVTPAPTDPPSAERLIRNAVAAGADGTADAANEGRIDTIGLLAAAGLVASPEPLEPGSPADLAFWSADPEGIPPDAAASLRIVAIVRGGAFTHGDEHAGPFSRLPGRARP